ncbi:hypothetical protein R1sor_003762 [Riccia sorocarpa]|uniref:Preprotein translocase subunit SCY2, chloroplastic n=1 Tax=Riccia sorocarpa TaxID=122646 RepID=A0ABD3H2J8_9MARC
MARPLARSSLHTHSLISPPATTGRTETVSTSQWSGFKLNKKWVGLQSQLKILNPASSRRLSGVEFGAHLRKGRILRPLGGRSPALYCRASYSVAGENSPEFSTPAIPQGRPFKNRLLGISKFGSVINDAAESFFKSEIRRRIFVTVALILASRVGYFIPIPGFDRRFMPGDYLALVSGAVEELGDLVSELKLAVFQLGISPYIFSSIIMQVACHLIPSLSKLRKEGLDGNEKIKKYTWWLALFIAVIESLVVSLHSAQYSIYSATNGLAYVLITSSFLTVGAMSINWICEKITESGFGQGSSLIICISILTGYSENLYRMVSNLLNGVTDWVPLGLFLGCFLLITMWAVIVTEGRRKVKLQYYDFELAPSAGGSSALPEVEPYIPFNINPTGMQPVLTTTYLMALPAVIAGLTGNKSWIGIRDTLNPAFPAAPGAKPWLYYLLNGMFIFLFNVLDIMDTPKEVADYMMKIGARIPNVKPGRRTIEYLSKVQASTRFWGGLLLALLATVSTLVDYRFRSLHQGGTIGFTSMLIIVGSIVELRRSFMAYNVMPSLSKVLRRYGV